MIVTYGIFAFRNPDEQEKHCWVVPDSTECLLEPQDGARDMTTIFNSLFIAGFVYSLSCLVGMSCHPIDHCGAKLVACTLLMVVHAPLIPFWIAVLGVFRLSHGGYVISGDFGVSESGLGYMPVSGRFLYILLMFQFTLFGCWILSTSVTCIRDLCMGASVGANKEYLQKYERVKKLGFGGQANIW